MNRVLIKADEYQLIGQEAGKGYLIQLSPYDIPKEVSAQKDPDGVFHVFLKYLDDEPAETRDLNERLKMKVGKNSGKILGFEVQVDKYDVHEVALQINEAVDQELSHLTKFNQKANYQVVQAVLNDNREPLFAGATG